MNKNSKIYIAGHRGMVGSAIWRALNFKGYTNLLGKTSEELDLRDQSAVNDFIIEEKQIPGIVSEALSEAGRAIRPATLFVNSKNIIKNTHRD